MTSSRAAPTYAAAPSIKAQRNLFFLTPYRLSNAVDRVDVSDFS
jgi:hypothetical protein